MGALPVRSGKISFMGSDIAPTRAEARARKGIGWVPQGREVFSMMTVQENLRTGLAARSDKKKEIPERIFELFPVLKSMLQRRGGDLSGGQQQQLAMGRALALDPKLLILDEPTEGIQPTIVAEIEQTIMQLADEGINVLLVEQHIGFALEAAERYVVLASGFVTQTDEGGAAATSTVRAAMAI
jgi:urea transport system ATP-binding protein